MWYDKTNKINKYISLINQLIIINNRFNYRKLIIIN